jgi:hypothetical protein
MITERQRIEALALCDRIQETIAKINHDFAEARRVIAEEAERLQREAA